MRQVAQRPRDGRIEVVDVPEPALRPGFVLVENRVSLLSAGTERSKLELGRKSLAGKARARPDLVAKVVERARTEGVRAAVAAARERLDALSPLGYSCSGVVRSVGTGVEGIAPGDLVACGGGGYANHAETVSVPRNLVAKVPHGVSLESAAYATLGAIALHGVRRAEAAVGERIGVIGLGLVGQLAVRVLLAAGCRAIAVDVDARAVALAGDAGALALHRDDPALPACVREATAGIGLDAVLLCAASATSDPLELAASLARDRARIVVVGDVAVEAERAVLYEKELELRLSRSYGPGRYDRDYEERGRDLPAGYVRWTEQRNIEAFLDLVAAGRVDPAPLTTHRFPIERAADAYAALEPRADDRAFGVLIEYSVSTPPAAASLPPRATRARSETVRVGIVGAGSFSGRVLLPALRDAGAELASIASLGGLSAADAAARLGVGHPAASVDELIANVDAVVVATRHGDHARLAAQALRAGKAVLVEKPLALTWSQLADVEDALSGGDGTLMVGFNRRFAPLVERLRDELEHAPQALLALRVNAGPLPADHWLHDPVDGGGRLLGEGCHFVDLLAHLIGAPPVLVHAVARPEPDRPIAATDSFAATLRFAGGSIANLVYAGDGDPRLPKERLEAFGGGLAAVLDDFRRLDLYRNGRRERVRGNRDKGHRAQVARFVAVAAGHAEAPPAESYVASTRATLALVDSLNGGVPVELP